MKINVKDSKKLNKAIKAAEGKSWARTMTAEDIQPLISDIESVLRLMAPKKEWLGSTFDLTNAHHIACSYFGYPKSTFVRIERFTSGWFVTRISREDAKNIAIFPVKLPKFSNSERHVRKVFNSVK
ncbi:hypothetical protein [Mariprofundus ferrooxydans]|nr:hypothetical protein [Mariprofundus ferrooxydans]